ncbi:MAG: glycoside hydrolase family 99-like domain-containing protein, partial [Vicinamibacterales bacterium]
YYGWYDDGHRAELGYLGPHLPQPLEPALGEYQSLDPDVVNTHVRWAAEYGIDFFIISWNAAGNTADRQARELLLPALEQSSVRQAPIIETLAYRDIDLFNPDDRAALNAEVRYVAENYLGHPSAMRIDGRPLLFLYTTRRLQGDIVGWLAEVRVELATLGINPYIVGDEAFWQPADLDRLHEFDAITAYNVYDWPLTQHAGWASDSTFFEDVDALFSRWREAARDTGIAFIPNALPGYNDRGVRLEEDHYVIPRAARRFGYRTGFFERSIELAKEHVDPELKLVTITSFNEWHEWTQIEPARESGKSPAGNPEAYTQGFPHPAYAFQYLEMLRDRLGPAGSP